MPNKPLIQPSVNRHFLDKPYPDLKRRQIAMKPDEVSLKKTLKISGLDQLLEENRAVGCVNTITQLRRVYARAN